MRKISLFAIVLFVLLSQSCKHHDAGKKENSLYLVTRPLILDTVFAKDYIAQIQSVQNIEIRSQVKGFLQNIYVDEGQLVQAGQLLFGIMPKMYEAEVAKQKAEIKTAEIELANTKSLAENNIVSKSELALAKSKLEQQKAELAKVSTELSFTKIRAPYNGIIDRIKFKKGSLIDEGGLITTLSNNKDVYAYFNFSEVEYLNYKKNHPNDNQIVSLILANSEEYRYKGTIETIEGEFNSETGTIALRAKFMNPEGLLRHGETGKVRLLIPLTRSMVIPQKCTYELQDKIYVYVVDENNTISSKEISILQKLSNLYVVGDGLNEGDRILLEGLQSAKEGEKITPKYVNPREVINNLQLIK